MIAPIDLPTPPRNILIIKPSALGDIVHTLPVLNLLRRRFAAARISWLVGSPFAGLIEGHPQLDEVICFDRKRFGAGWRSPGALLGLARFLRDLGRREFDLVIDLQGLFRSGCLCALTHAPRRIGFGNAREMAPLFYTDPVPIETMEQHAIERYLSVTEALGCGRAPVEFNFVVTDADRAHVESLVGGIGRYAVLMPGTNWPTKRWGVERFAELVGPLRERLGLRAVVAGGADAVPLAGHIPADVNAAGRTSLRQLVALLQGAALVIANDSGPMHIASALNRPLVTMFGPTNPIRTGPYARLDSVVRVDIPCSPCYSRTCSHISCMNSITIQHVLSQASIQMGAAEANAGAAEAPSQRTS